MTIMTDKTSVHIADMPIALKAMTRKNPDGSSTIVINSRHCHEQNKKAYLHEITHLENGDFDQPQNVGQLEAARHKESGGALLSAVSLGLVLTEDETRRAIKEIAALAENALPAPKRARPNLEPLLDKLDAQNIALKYAHLPGGIKGLYINDGQTPKIVINRLIPDAEDEPYLHRCIIAEQLGHHFTSLGSPFYCAANFPFWLLGEDKIATKALTWSALQLIPYKEIRKIKHQTNLIGDLAERFEVTKELLIFRLGMLRQNDFLCDEDLAGI